MYPNAVAISWIITTAHRRHYRLLKKNPFASIIKSFRQIRNWTIIERRKCLFEEFKMKKVLTNYNKNSLCRINVKRIRRKNSLGRFRMKKMLIWRMEKVMQFMKSTLSPVALFPFALFQEAGFFHLLCNKYKTKHGKVLISLVGGLTNRVRTSYTLTGSSVSVVSEGPQ